MTVIATKLMVRKQQATNIDMAKSLRISIVAKPTENS